MKIVETMAGLVAVLGVAFCSGGAFAEQKGTAEQREACTPDAFRLCTTAFPDEGAVEQCLRGAAAKLSPACYAVFYPTQQPDARAGRPLPPTVGNAYARQPDPAQRTDRARVAPAPGLAPPAGDDGD